MRPLVLRVPAALVILGLSSGPGAQAPLTVQDILDRGGERIRSTELDSMARGSTYVSRGGAMQLKIVPDGSVSGYLSGGPGNSGIWGKWWINAAGFMCMDTQSTFTGTYRGCFAVYRLDGKLFGAPRSGPQNPEPPPEAKAFEMEFRR